MYKPPGSPDCFGTHLWSATDKECIGGPDPGYTHPVSGAHTRERCKWYQTCATASAQNRTQSQLIPPQNLVRQPPPAPPPQAVPAIPPGVQPPPRPVAPPPGLAPRAPLHQPQPFYSQYPQQPQPVQPVYQPPMFVPPYVAQMGPAQIPMQYQQPGAQMPAYLTMPEPIEPGDGAIKVLARTLFRSMLKAFGHSLSSFVDHTPMKPHKPPEQ